MRFNKFLIGAATAIVAVCSCTTPMQELSSYWEGHDFTSLDAFDDIPSNHSLLYGGFTWFSVQ